MRVNIASLAWYFFYPEIYCCIERGCSMATHTEHSIHSMYHAKNHKCTQIGDGIFVVAYVFEHKRWCCLQTLNAGSRCWMMQFTFGNETRVKKTVARSHGENRIRMDRLRMNRCWAVLVLRRFFVCCFLSKDSLLTHHSIGTRKKK